jgi:DNA invertase Pin-like site-specific DNA recombinase
MNDGQEKQPPRTPAAQYIRMSTEHQQYSTENQADIIRDYAAKRGFEIVRTYVDEGKSGLNIEGRGALQRLLADVKNGAADFKAILVYDVSRWGRFQDADEPAYYEFICRSAGIQVHYCAEQFENDGSIQSAVFKSVKRAMAGEYSRELSAKVFKGQCRLITLGYRQGGPAGYGLRRMLIDERGQDKGALRRGEKKSIQTDRVVLVPGPKEEIAVVRRIYEMFTSQGLKESQIAAVLNSEGTINTELARPWTGVMVHQVLTNEKYIGNNVYNRVSFKLKKKRVRNAPDHWVRRDGAFEPIVDPAVFYTARGIILERARRFTDEELLAKLKALLEAKGKLSVDLIDDAEGMPSSAAYQNRFGSLARAYERVGFDPGRDYGYVEVNRYLRALRSPFEADVVRRLEQLGATIARDAETGQLLINGEYTAEVVFTRCHQSAAGTLRWLVNLDRGQAADVTVVVRMDEANRTPTDFYLLPRIDVRTPAELRLGTSNGVAVDTYRRDTLDRFLALAARANIEVAA